MRVVVTAAGPDLSSQVDPRFGRSPYFILVDSESGQFEAIPNPNVQAMGGAGIKSAQFVAEKGAEVVLTGSCGPNAFQTLRAAGIQVITGVVGTVREAVERFKQGTLRPAAGPNVPSHFGMGAGMGRGMGPGMGRGMGMGMGMGMGWRRGGGMGPPGGAGAAPGFPADELAMLRQQARMLEEQISRIKKRIEELEKKRQG